MAVGQDDLFKVEAEVSAAGEVTCRLGLGDCADDGRALGYGDGVVRVVDGFRDNCVDRLT